MLRCFAATASVLALALVIGSGPVAAQKATKNQMVKGTIKSVDSSKDLLVINQKVKNESVERELSITPDTEVVLQVGGETKTANGTAGLRLLEGKEGSSVQVKCDKDVNVLKVTVKGK